VNKSNLFQVDLDAVARLLREANEGLVSRCQELGQAASRMPDTFSTDDEVRRAHRFAEQLNKCRGDIRRAKLSDSKPFASGKKAIDVFFGDFATPIDAALRKVERALTVTLIAPAPAPTPAVSVVTGEGAALIVGATNTENGVSRAIRDELPKVWEAARIDRARLDLNALRYLFTDNEIDRAVRRWLDKNGPEKLDGVTWRHVVKT
jgi:hypothetical protein